MTGDTPARLEVTVRGRVQGVGFRYFAMRLADELSLSGWVANERDGSVRCVAEGTRPALERFLDAVTDGPPGGRVDGVTAGWSVASGSFAGFEMRSAWHRGD